MKLNIHRHLPIALLLSAMSTPAIADSVSSIHAARINAANELVRTGEFAQAIEEYREIPVTELTQDELNYNSGVALYREGDVDAARALFSETSTSANNSIAAAARYNLGNCSYADAVATAEQDKKSAIDSLNQAITQYRASLRANPNHVDARANIELAVALQTKLGDELKQEQEQQEQEQDKQEQEQNQEQNQESQEDQKSEQQGSDSEKSESGQEQENEQSPPAESDSDSSEKQKDPQSSADESSESDEQSEQKSAQQADGQPSEEGSDESESSESEPQSAENEQSEQQPQPTSQDENSKSQSAQQSQSADESAADEASEQKDDVVPSGQLKPASEQQQQEGPQGTVAVPSGDEELMTREEALKMLQSVRDRDMLRRLRHEQAERNRHVPTDRDW